MRPHPRHLRRDHILRFIPLALSACASKAPDAVDTHAEPKLVILSGLTLVGHEGASSEPMDLAMADGLITEVVPAGSRDWGEAERIELSEHLSLIHI